MIRVSFPGYKLVSSSCRKTAKNGGSCIFVKDNLDGLAITDKASLNREKDFEFSAIHLKSIGYKIVCIYRAPSGDIEYFFKSLDQLMRNLKSDYSKTIICGDFNIDWLPNDSSKTRLCDFFNSHNLFSLNTSPTRVTSHSASCIDYVATNMTDPGIVCKVESLAISDHYALLANFPQLAAAKNIKHFSRKFSSQKFDSFHRQIAGTDWGTDPDYDAFHIKITEIYDNCFPLTKTSSSNLRKAWLTDEVIRSSDQLKILFRQKQLDDSSEMLVRYNICKMQHRQLIQRTKKAANDAYLMSQDNKSKAIWNIVKFETGRTPSVLDKVCKIHDNSGSPFLAPADQANFINSYFCDIGSSMQRAIAARPFRPPPPSHHSFTLTPTDDQEVLKCLKALKSKNCPDIDGISTRVIKDSSDYLIPILTKLVNHSFSTGIFPEHLKVAKVLPIYKGKGKVTDVKNYRPISILPAFSKVFESIVKSRLIKFLSEHSLLSESQHGFLPNRSTETAILDFINHVLEGLDSGNQVVGVFLDLSKAFDSVDHTLLLKKLSALGVQGSALSWFRSYLTNRKQTVAVEFFNESSSSLETAHSDTLPVSIGVPQGSVLGPLLFLVYINDLSSSLISGISKAIVFADDHDFLFTHENRDELQAKAQVDMDGVAGYFHSNLLTINESKSNIVHFCSRSNNDPIEISVNGMVLDNVQSTKFLGVTIDQKLNWHQHVVSLQAKLSAVNFSQRILAQSCTMKPILTAYFAYFHSLLSYGIAFWGCQKQNLDAIFVLQKRCIRIMTRKDPLTHCKPLFKELEIMTVPCVYIYRCILIVKSMPNLSLNSDLHSHNTRRRNDLHVPRARTTLNQHGPVPQGIRMLNALPTEIKSVSDPKKFKSDLKSFLLGKLYYCVDELYSDS